jgi:lipoyl synthase
LLPHLSIKQTPMEKPRWLRRKLPTGTNYRSICQLIENHQLATVCQEARCPNQFECFANRTATFMILGRRCSRNCRFCAVDSGPQGQPDHEEPQRVAEAICSLGLRYAVITSVTRDDLSDGGANHFVATIQAIRSWNPHTLIEVLVPDFCGERDLLALVLEAGPDVLNHNLETVERLYSEVRPQAIYRRSLDLLWQSKALAPQIVTKSGMMVGLGERRDERSGLFDDLRRANCDILTIGQYLQPSESHLPVTRFIPPEEFDAMEKEARTFGYRAVAAGPFVRSSYQAAFLYRQARLSISEDM